MNSRKPLTKTAALYIRLYELNITNRHLCYKKSARKLSYVNDFLKNIYFERNRFQGRRTSNLLVWKGHEKVVCPFEWSKPSVLKDAVT